MKKKLTVVFGYFVLTTGLVLLNNFMFRNWLLPAQANFHGLSILLRYIIRIEGLLEFVLTPFSEVLGAIYFGGKPIFTPMKYDLARLVGIPISFSFYFMLIWLYGRWRRIKPLTGAKNP